MSTDNGAEDPSTIRLSFENGVAWVTFDARGERVNKLSREAMARLADFSVVVGGS